MKIPKIIVSKNVLEKAIKESDSGFIKEIYSKENPHINFDNIKISFAERNNNWGVVKSHVDISLVSVNDELSIEGYKKWRPEFKDAHFVVEQDGKFICSREVEKMSKSKWNVVNPDDVIDQHGADTLRMYEMFLGPLEQSKPWNTNGISGVSNFIRKFWRLYHDQKNNFSISEDEPTKAELKALHKTIKKIQEDIERFSFNTSVSTFMICVNELTDLKCNKRAILEPLAILLSPYAPHITEELWSLMGHKESITFASFPEFREEYITESSFEYPVSVNGKLRFKMDLPLSLTAPEIEREVISSEEAKKYLEGKSPKKVIVVHNKIVNIVV